MLVKPFDQLIDSKKKPEDLWYLGTVEDNEDPEKLGRVKAVISIFNGMKTEELPWAYPILGPYGNISSAGGLNVPEVGSQVRVLFPNSDTTMPFYMGAELNSVNKITFFDDDYPDTYGYKDSIGNFYKINKARKTAQFQHSSTSNLKVAPDGSMQVSLSNGAYFTFSNMNAFELNIGQVDIKGSPEGRLSANAASEIEMKTGSFRVDAKVTEFSGDVSIGTGASGMFWTLGNIVTVKNGIIVSIE